MSARIWDKFLTERDKAVFAAGGFGARAGFGKRPALLVVDVNWAFCGERQEPILESIRRWRTSCGEAAWVALDYIKALIEAARAKEVPVIYTTGERRADNWDAGSWRWKSSRGEEASGSVHEDIDGNEIAIDRRQKRLVVWCEIARYAQIHTVGSVSLKRMEPQDAVAIVIERGQRKSIKQAIACGRVNISVGIHGWSTASCPDPARAAVGCCVEDTWRLR